MKLRIINKTIFFILLLTLYIPSTQAKEIWLKNIPTAKLTELYQQVGYTGWKDKDWLMIPSHKYPAILLKNFPEDFAQITDEKERNSLFIRIMAPLAMHLNENLLQERQIILDLQNEFEQNKKLSDKQVKLLEDKAIKYDVFSRLKGSERLTYLLSELLNRIDIIPPSIMITIAAIETNFGTSRIVKEGNALYKILNWNTKEGLKPIGEKENAEYRIRTYPNIYKSMEDFALRLNSSVNFSFFRITRASKRQSASTHRIKGDSIAAFLFTNSELKNYAGIIDYTLSYYELSVIDRSALDSANLSGEILKKYSKYITKK